jgi:hypothetical protein
MIKTKRLTITPIICQAYELYFGFKVNHQDIVAGPALQIQEIG